MTVSGRMLTAIGAITFFLVQVLFLEIRTASVERRELYSDIAKVRAQMTAWEARERLLDRRIRDVGEFVLRAHYPRAYSEDSPPPPEL